MDRNSLIRRLGIGLIMVALAWLGIEITQEGSIGRPHPEDGLHPGYYHVTHVSDGDTFVVQIAGRHEIVRLIGIDTPETHDPRKPVQCYGPAAATEAHRLLEGKEVRLEGDPTGSDRDKYRRLLRYVYLADGTLYNQYMVTHGFAFAYTVFTNSKLEQFKQWEAEARGRRVGIWANCQVHKDGAIEQTQSMPKDR